MTRNWFDAVEHGFGCCVQTNKHINAAKFLDAAQCFTTILNDQKHLVFLPIKQRFGNNVKQMRGTYDELHELMPDQDLTLHDLITFEKAAGRSDVETECASRGVMWFTRATQFLVHAFDCSLANETEPLKESFRSAYEHTLGIHHSTMVKPLFEAAMTFCPDRETFYKQLCRDDPMALTLTQAKIYFNVLRGVKERLVQFCCAHGFDVRYGNKTEEDMKKCYLSKKRIVSRDEGQSEKSPKKGRKGAQP